MKNNSNKQFYLKSTIRYKTKTMEIPHRLTFENILTEKQVNKIIKEHFGEVSPKFIKGEVKPAAEGIAGFLGEHIRVILHVEEESKVKKLPLFVKRVPRENKPKLEFVDKNNFFRREQLMYQVFDTIFEDGPIPWCVKAYINTDCMLVLPDLSVQGYAPRNFLQTFDTEHVFLTTTSIAGYHAAFVNYETKKTSNLQRPYKISEEFGHILEETQFTDGTFIKSGAKLIANFLKKYSKKRTCNVPDLEERIFKLFLQACDSSKEYKETVNVLIHKDLWVNNILFKYEDNIPTNAILVDFQAVRYAPPAFDLMVLLYLTTDRKFREVMEKDVEDHYYSVFFEKLTKESKRRLENLGYNKESFLKWCEKGRMFGIFLSCIINPFALLDPKTAQNAFDNPDTFEKYINEDRSEPLLAHADKCAAYKDRLLDLTEDFVDRYL